MSEFSVCYESVLLLECDHCCYGVCSEDTIGSGLPAAESCPDEEFLQELDLCALVAFLEIPPARR